jgi:hypothetical protein
MKHIFGTWDGTSFALPLPGHDAGWAQRMRPSIRCRAVVAGRRRSRSSPCYRAIQGYTGNTQVLTLPPAPRASHSPGGVQAAGRISGLTRSVWKHREDNVEAFQGTEMCACADLAHLRPTTTTTDRTRIGC